MGGMGIGIPELLILLMIVVTGVVPIAATIWALFMLHKMRVDQQATRRTVENIEQLLQRR
jgi:hypothetical protein